MQMIKLLYGLLAGAGMSSPTTSTPGWIAAAHGSGGGLQQLHQQHQLLGSSPIKSLHAAGSLRAQAASSGSLQQGGSGGGDADDAYATHILNMVMQKLAIERSAAGAGLPKQSS
jgi:hypothetical protein